MTVPRDVVTGYGVPAGKLPARRTSPSGLTSSGLAHRGLSGLAQEVLVAVRHPDVSERGLLGLAAQAELPGALVPGCVGVEVPDSLLCQGPRGVGIHRVLLCAGAPLRPARLRMPVRPWPRHRA